jgi:hypothetical protein
MKNAKSWSTLVLVAVLSVLSAACSVETDESGGEDNTGSSTPTVAVTPGVETNAVVVTPVCTPPLCRGPAAENGRPTFVRGYCGVSETGSCSCGCGSFL